MSTNETSFSTGWRSPKKIAYPDSRKQIDTTANPTYKLSPLDRNIVGLLQVIGCWSNTSIGEAFGIDRAAVSRHGKRVREELASGKLSLSCNRPRE